MTEYLNCPMCGNAIADKDQGCPACQVTLQAVCLGCGQTVAAQYRYCPHCGQPANTGAEAYTYRELAQINELNRVQLISYAQDLTDLYAWKKQLEQFLPSGLLDKVSNAEQSVVGERRYLTVLFSDVVGFTKLSSTMDAESVFMLMNDCFRALVEQVYRYGGTIDKFLGDGMMALFGAPISHGNDAERAVRAALGMQEAMVVFNQKMMPTLGYALSLRVGITSGEAIAGLVGVKGKQSYTVMGSTVNLASRLEGACTPGSVLVNEDIYDQTASLFNYRVLTPIDVKGFSEPVPVFEAVNQQEDIKSFNQLPAKNLSPFIGRQAELEALANTCRDWQSTTGNIIFVSGEAGLGKTRLMMEWQKQLSPHFQVWPGVAQSFSQVGYAIWQQLILDGLSLHNASAERAIKILRDCLDGEALVPFLMYLLFGPTPETEMISSLEPEQLKEQIFLAVSRLLQNTAKTHPLVIILDNFQWIDQLSQELLAASFPLARSYPIIFCVVSHPEADGLDGLISRTTQSLENHTLDIRLRGLSTAESEAFLWQNLPVVGMPDSIRAHILERAQRNPFHLEEIVSFMVNRGYVEQDDTGWRIVNEAGLMSASLPGTLRSLIQAQIDILPKNAQQILAYASVIGTSFSAALFLQLLNNALQITKLDTHLAGLVDQNMLAFDGRNYRFVHNVVQETMYQSLLTDRRRYMHFMIGETIEAGSPLETEKLAYHFTEAGQPAKAIPYLIAAGEKAASQFSNRNALNYFLTVLTLLPEVPTLPGQEVQVLKSVGDLFEHLGDYDQALTYYQRAAEQAIDMNQQADCSRLVGRIWRLKGNIDQAQSWLTLALQKATDTQNKADIEAVVLGRIYADIGLLYMYERDFAQAEKWGINAVSTLDKAGALADLARSLNALGGVYYFQHQWHKASQQVERAYTIQEQIGDQMGLAASLGNLGMLYVTDCQWGKAIEVFKQTIAMCEEMGALQATLGNAHNNIAYLYLHQGKYRLAETHLEQSLSIKRESDTMLEMAASLNNLGLVRLLQGDYAAAEKTISESIRLCKAGGNADSLCEATRYLAEIKLTTGDRNAALRLCEQALAQAEEIGSKTDVGNALRVLAQVYLAYDEPRLANQKGQDSLAILTEVDARYEIARTQLVLAEIALAQNEPEQMAHDLQAASDVLQQLQAEPYLKIVAELETKAARLA